MSPVAEALAGGAHQGLGHPQLLADARRQRLRRPDEGPQLVVLLPLHRQKLAVAAPAPLAQVDALVLELPLVAVENRQRQQGAGPEARAMAQGQ